MQTVIWCAFWRIYNFLSEQKQKDKKKNSRIKFIIWKICHSEHQLQWMKYHFYRILVFFCYLVFVCFFFFAKPNAFTIYINDKCLMRFYVSEFEQMKNAIIIFHYLLSFLLETVWMRAACEKCSYSTWNSVHLVIELPNEWMI